MNVFSKVLLKNRGLAHDSRHVLVVTNVHTIQHNLQKYPHK